MKSSGMPVKRNWIKADFISKTIETQRAIAGATGNCAGKEQNSCGNIRSICHMSKGYLLISFRWIRFRILSLYGHCRTSIAIASGK